jgi:hypothetical protein
MSTKRRTQDCVCEAVDELEWLLRRKRDEFVVVATAGGDVKFGWVHKVCDDVLVLKFVAFYSPACSCAPLFAYKAIIPLYQITDVLEGLEMSDERYRDAFQHIESRRQQEQNVTNP